MPAGDWLGTLVDGGVGAVAGAVVGGLIGGHYARRGSKDAAALARAQAALAAAEEVSVALSGAGDKVWRAGQANDDQWASEARDEVQRAILRHGPALPTELQMLLMQVRYAQDEWLRHRKWHHQDQYLVYNNLVPFMSWVAECLARFRSDRERPPRPDDPVQFPEDLRQEVQ